MSHPENDEQVGVALLHQVLVSPGVNRSAAMEVDVRTDDRAQPTLRGPIAAGAVRRGQRQNPRTVAGLEKSIEVASKPSGLRGVRESRQRGRSLGGVLERSNGRGESRPFERERLVNSLGDCGMLILRNHGTLTVGASVAQAFVRMYFLERACDAQILMLSAGRENRQCSPMRRPGSSPPSASATTSSAVTCSSSAACSRTATVPTGP